MKYNLKSSIGRFLFTGILEGISYVVLLFIAMPLKYIANKPMAVEITGMIHGILFVLYCILLLMAMIEHKWSIGKGIIAFIASLIPFGAFFLERILKIKNPQ